MPFSREADTEISAPLELSNQVDADTAAVIYSRFDI